MITNIHHTAKHGSYAHFPGTGPKGKFCERCQFFRQEKRQGWGTCLKHASMMRGEGGQIRGSSESCKYWDGR